MNNKDQCENCGEPWGMAYCEVCIHYFKMKRDDELDNKNKVEAEKAQVEGSLGKG